MTTKSCNVSKYWVVAKLLHQFFGSSHAANWHSTTQSFACRHYIRNNVKMLKCPHFSCSAHATLYFIQNQQCSSFITALSQSLQIGFVWNSNASISLNCF